MSKDRLKTDKAGHNVDPDLIETPCKHADGGCLYLQVAHPG